MIPRANLARLAAGLVALAVGLGALAVTQGPGRFTTYAGRSGLAATLTVAAGLALVVAGLVTAFSIVETGDAERRRLERDLHDVAPNSDYWRSPTTSGSPHANAEADGDAQTGPAPHRGDQSSAGGPW